MTTARELDTVRVLVALSKARSSRGLTRAHTFSAMPTTVENKLETPGVECSLRHSESRTFTRTEVQEIMEREKQGDIFASPDQLTGVLDCGILLFWGF